jgi:hypothetical protein
MKFPRPSNLYIIFFIWLLVQAIIIANYGIVSTGEAEKYIGEAQILSNTGHLSATNYWFYSLQIFLLVLAIKTGLGYILVLIIQLLFSAWATYAFYRLLGTIFPPPVAMAGTVLLLLNIPLQEFNTFLQTESLFYSITIIFISYLLRLTKLTAPHFLLILLVTLIICITRPTGLLFVPAISLYVFFRYINGISTRIKIILVIIGAMGFLFVMNAVIGSKGEWDFMLPYLHEQIICGVPTLDHNAAIKTDPDGNSIYGLFYYTVHNFGQFSRMALLRSKAFFGLQRTYYSTAHNIYLAAFFYPLYLAAILSIKWWVKNHPYKIAFISCCVILTWVTTFLTCDDWHNRWLLSISPWIILLGLPSMTKLFTILTAYGSNRNIQ